MRISCAKREGTYFDIVHVPEIFIAHPWNLLSQLIVGKSLVVFAGRSLLRVAATITVRGARDIDFDHVLAFLWLCIARCFGTRRTLPLEGGDEEGEREVEIRGLSRGLGLTTM